MQHEVTHRSAWIRLVVALGAASITACGPGGGGGNDAGTEEAGTMDVVTPMEETGPGPDVVEPSDVVTPTDAVTPEDSGAPAFTEDTAPRALRFSMTGHDRLWGVTADRSGNFFAVGNIADSTESSADYRTLVAKFLPNGQLDTSFGTNGFVTHNLAVGTNGEVTRGIVVQPSGRIVVYGTVEAAGAMDARDRDVALARLNADGTLDSSFGTNGVLTINVTDGAEDGSGYAADSAWSLSMYDDGRLLLTGATRRMGGTDTDWFLLRLGVDGARDMAFGTNGTFTLDINNRSATPRNATILADGHIVYAGYYNDGGVIKPMLCKLTPSGQLDSRFGENGVYTETVLGAIAEAYAAAPQGDRFVTTGYGRNDATENIDWLSLRINANGTRDMSYGNGNGIGRYDYMGFADNARTLIVLPDNRLVMVGGGRVDAMNSNGRIGMFTENGQPLTSWGMNGYRTFDLGGGTDFFWGAAIAPSNDRILVVGHSATVMGGNDDAFAYVMAVPR